jgi:predicted DsbA family dithiol-disulfide isomerase
LDELFAGRGIDIPAVLEHLKRVAAECGLPFGARDKTFNSRKAQELSKWAESLGRGEDFHMAAFRAYFVDGLNIAKIPVLTGLVEALNLDGAEAERVLGILSNPRNHCRAYLHGRRQDNCRGPAL